MNNEFLSSLGEKIRQIRKSKDKSLLDIAAATGIDKPHVSAIENGKRNITVQTLKKIADALEVEPFELLQ